MRNLKFNDMLVSTRSFPSVNKSEYGDKLNNI